jgi:L-threonylcarbamoyladenylate synthase
MKTLRLRLTPPNADSLRAVDPTTSAPPEADEVSKNPALLKAAAILRGGGLVAFPTETVYGLGANALDAIAVEKIFAAKQRPHWDPIIVHVAEAAAARGLVAEWPEAAERLAQSFWPGPLTMLLPRKSVVPDVVTAGREKVGIRLPAHPVARALVAAAGVPIAAPSANRFGHTSPTSAEHVLADLDGRIDAVLDAGGCAIGVESTVMDPTTNPAMVYRPGGVTVEQLRAALSGLGIGVKLAEHIPYDSTTGAGSELAQEGASPEALLSPGMGMRHYAPRARMVLVDDEDGLRQAVEREARQHRVGALLPEEWPMPAGAPGSTMVVRWGRWSDPQSLARELYAKMRMLDEAGVEAIVCPLPKAEGIGVALRDRLRKAAK